MSTYILGIDAAWTFEHPAGLALVQADGASLSANMISGSYTDFLLGNQGYGDVHKGTRPDMKGILEKCSNLDYDVSLVAFDLPLSPAKIVTRRESDAQISIKYGGRGASTHTPNPSRPGAISEMIYEEMTALGYCWDGAPGIKSFIEVYPHTAVLELFDYPYRFPYKVENRSKYWKNLTPEQRMQRIIANLNELRGKIVGLIPNVAVLLPEAQKGMSISMLKSYEDCLDALICAVTGCYYLQGQTIRYGDKVSAIWVPYKQ